MILQIGFILSQTYKDFSRSSQFLVNLIPTYFFSKVGSNLLLMF
ncbi:MAG: hypothetical protein JWO09_2311 [Bacteroidetes bacterium]|nr:hypothetical protein [Bacteroidota bacterium]